MAMAMASSSCCSITKPIFNLPSLTTKKPLSPIIIISTTKPNKPIKLLHISKRHRFLSHLSQSSSEWETAADDSTVTLAQQQDDKAVEEEQEVAEPAWGNTQQGGGGGEEEEEEEGVFEEPSEDAKLFVGNLPYDVDSQKLASIFEQAGVVEIAEVIYNRDSDQSRGFGFVTMSTVEEAEKAVDMFNRYDLDGRLLTVNKAAPRGQRPERPPRVFEPSYRVYVGNLPWGVDDGRLEQLFSEHGKVTSARVIYDRETGRSRGFGFVTMATESEMNDSIAALDGQTMDGRAIRVNVAEERPRRMF